jgi:phosphohistidine phosphatase SixA
VNTKNYLRIFGIAAAIAMTTCLLAAPAVAQEAVFVVRHAERLDSSSDSPLSAEGHQRARRLAQLLRDARITAVFVTQYVRTLDTARPLADALGVAPQQVPAAQTADLVARIRSLGPQARVLVVGHSDTLPTILSALGRPGDLVIASDEYDNLFIVHPPPAPPPVATPATAAATTNASVTTQGTTGTAATPVVIRLRY